MGEYLYSGLGVAVREIAEGELYEFGVLVDGGFVGLGSRKAGDVKEAVAAAKAEADAAPAPSSDTPTTTG
jgi:ribosomal protein S5